MVGRADHGTTAAELVPRNATTRYGRLARLAQQAPAPDPSPAMSAPRARARKREVKVAGWSATFDRDTLVVKSCSKCK